MDKKESSDINNINNTIKQTITHLLGPSAASHFLSFLVINFILYIVTLGAIFTLAPSEIKWLPKIIFFTCILMASVTSGYSAIKNRDRENYFQTTNAIVESIPVSIIGAGILIIIYFSIYFISPPDYVTTTELNQAMSSLRREFYSMGLNDAQTNQVLKILREGGYVTKDELPKDLTEEQKTEVLNLINSSIQSFAATMTAVPQVSCYLTLSDTAETVYIRDKADKSEGRVIDYLDLNDVALVLGHNGGFQQARWWYIQVKHRGITTRGWIIGVWAKLLNGENCSQVEQIATPFP